MEISGFLSLSCLTLELVSLTRVCDTIPCVIKWSCPWEPYCSLQLPKQLHVLLLHLTGTRGRVHGITLSSRDLCTKRFCLKRYGTKKTNSKYYIWDTTLIEGGTELKYQWASRFLSECKTSLQILVWLWIKLSIVCLISTTVLISNK